MTNDEARGIGERLERIEEQVSAMSRLLSRLETMLETEAARCPYRESIARASNNIARLEKVEALVQANRVRIAEIAVLAGAGGGGVVALVTAWLRGG